MAETEF